MKLISVVIPTFDREASLSRLLHSIVQQSMDPESFEVIIVDDGSPSNPLKNGNSSFPFALQYIRQENKGATLARNNGVMNSHGQILVFIDDDMTISPKTLQALMDACNQEKKVVALGSIVSRNENTESVFTRIAVANDDHFPSPGQSNYQAIDFVECNTQLLAISRQYFLELDMLQDPTGGWPNWDDVDFGFRAHNAGFQIVRVRDAKGEHWDNSLSTLENSCQRWYRASKSAVRLFQKHPALRSSIPMYADKAPIDWREDSPSLITRKVVRIFASSKTAIYMMRTSIHLLENNFPEPKLLRPLYRWICGAYMFQGYQEGLKEN